MTVYLRKTIPLLFFFSLTIHCYTQSDQTEQYGLFDQMAGIENTGLYQGIVYAEKYRVINEKNQFFETRDFLPGSVHYDGQDYYDLNLKYNVYDDEVLLRLISSVGGGTLQLFTDRIKNFEINGSHFIKLTPEDDADLNSYGFYKISMVGPYFTLYTKFTKKRFERKDRRAIYSEFVPGKSEYVLLYNNKYHLLDSKKAITELFADQKKQIDKFYNLARQLRNSDSDAFHIALMKRIEILLSQSANQ